MMTGLPDARHLPAGQPDIGTKLMTTPPEM